MPIASTMQGPSSPWPESRRATPSIPSRRFGRAVGAGQGRGSENHEQSCGDRLMMHAEERERTILSLIEKRGFVTFRELDRRSIASPATVRRDLERLAVAGRIVRVHWGAKMPDVLA